jgi:hypothetical protein
MPLSHAMHRATKTLRLRLLEPMLHAGFALTGVGTVLLGCILPQVSSQWHLRDKDAGLLLLVQFATSASGALLVRRLWKTLVAATGYLAPERSAFFCCNTDHFRYLRSLLQDMDWGSAWR